MASTRTDGLGFLDRLVILVAWLASCGVVFVIGYYVGKDAVPPSVAIAPGAIQVPVAGVPAGPGEAGAEGTGTFYESLGRQTGVPAALPSGRVTTTLPARAAAVARLTTSTAALPTTTSTAAPVTTTSSTAAPARTTTTSETSLAPLASSTTIVAPRPTTTRPPGAVAGTPTGRGWTLYASPTRDRFEAERQRSVLRAAGYDASVVRMQRDGDAWYRVRAGRFDSEASAERARRDLRDRGIGHAFVQSE